MSFRVSIGRRTLPIGLPTLEQVQELAQQAQTAAQAAAADAVAAAQPGIDAAVVQAAQEAAQQVAPAAADAIRAQVAAAADRAEVAATNVGGLVDAIVTRGTQAVTGTPSGTLATGYQVDARPFTRAGRITSVRVYRATAGNFRLHLFTKSGAPDVIAAGDIFTTRFQQTFNNLAVGWTDLTVDIPVAAGDYLGALTSAIGAETGGAWPGGSVYSATTTHPFTLASTAAPAAALAVQWTVFLPGDLPKLRQDVDGAGATAGDALTRATTAETLAAEAKVAADAVAPQVSDLVGSTRQIGAASVADATGAATATSGQHASAIAITKPCRLRRIRFHRATDGNHRTQIMTRDGAGLMTLRKSVLINGLTAGYHDLEVNEDLLPGDHLAALAIGHLGRAGATWDGGMYWATGATMPWTDADADSPPAVPMLIEWVIDVPGEVPALKDRVATLEASPSGGGVAAAIPQSFAPQLIADSLAVPSRFFGRSTAFANSTGFRAYSPPFQDQTRRLMNGAKVSLRWLTADQRTLWYAVNGSSQIWTGTPDNFLGQSGNLMTLPTGCAVRTHTIDATKIAVEVLAGTPTFSTMAEPTYAQTFAFLGQSHDNLTVGGGAPGGFADGIRDAGWVQATVDVIPAWINCAYGSSSVFLSTKGDDGNWWVDDSGGTLAPGPRLTGARATIDAAVAEGKPLPSVFFVGGPGDAQEAQMGVGGKTIEQLRDGYLYIWDTVKTRCPDALFLITPHPLNDRDDNHKGAIATRRAMLMARDARAWCYPGAERYDQPRVLGEIHTTDMGHYRHGYRCARAYANAVHGQANRLGPRITGAVRAADNLSITLTLDRAFGPLTTRLPEPDMTGGRRSGPMPYGLAAIDATTGDVIPLLYGEQAGADRDATGDGHRGRPRGRVHR